MNNKDICREVAERAFNQADLSAIDEYVAVDGIDHQERPGTPIIPHLKHVITSLHTAFPDIHFAIHDMLGEEDLVAFCMMMTGTHLGPLALGPGPQVPPTGCKVEINHLYVLRFTNGKNVDLWHEWNVPKMLQQLGIMPGPNH